MFNEDGVFETHALARNDRNAQKFSYYSKQWASSGARLELSSNVDNI